MEKGSGLLTAMCVAEVAVVRVLLCVEHAEALQQPQVTCRGGRVRREQCLCESFFGGAFAHPVLLHSTVVCTIHVCALS